MPVTARTNDTSAMKLLLKEVLDHEVYPAMGCTEPVAVALCAARAAELLKKPAARVEVRLDPGTFKNGLAVALPNTGGQKGNALAAAVGAVLADHRAGAGIFKGLSGKSLEAARALLRSGSVSLRPDHSKRGIYMAVKVAAGRDSALCVVAGGHARVVRLERNGKPLKAGRGAESPSGLPAYKRLLKVADFGDLVAAAESAGPAELAYIEKGVKMNLRAAGAGMEVGKVGYYLKDLADKGFLRRDAVTDAKILSASATDARMAGMSLPVMSSGESGNQGVVASLVPWTVGRAAGVPKQKILRSIALSHMINAYIKVFTGELAPICGCAVAAGVGAAAAIVYQRRGGDRRALTLAVNNVISDIGGMLCDGAKSGCALKVASSADSAVRAAWMASAGEGITEEEGFIGATAEETIRNIARISKAGMGEVDRIMLDIMAGKNFR